MRDNNADLTTSHGSCSWAPAFKAITVKKKLGMCPFLGENEGQLPFGHLTHASRTTYSVNVSWP